MSPNSGINSAVSDMHRLTHDNLVPDQDPSPTNSHSAIKFTHENTLQLVGHVKLIYLSVCLSVEIKKFDHVEYHSGVETENWRDDATKGFCRLRRSTS